MSRAGVSVPKPESNSRRATRTGRATWAASATAASAAAVEALENRLLFAAVQWGGNVGGMSLRGPGDGFLIGPSTTGDFNGDGNIDVAALNATGQPRVALGDGKGSYTSLVSGSSGYGSPGFVIAADVNGDGKLDLLALDAATGNAVLYYGNGDGTFQAPVTYSVASTPGAGPSDVVVADFNGDGRPDFAVAVAGTDSLRLFLGQSGGGFTAAAPITLPSSPAHLAADDLDGDGNKDLVVAYTTQNIAVLWGNGDGTFTPSQFTVPQVTGPWPAGQTQVVAGDLNGDHRPDLVIAENTAAPEILLNQGSRTFSASATSSTAAIGNGSLVAIANLTNDGKPDLLVIQGTDRPSGGINALALVGAGDGTFVQAGFSQTTSSAGQGAAFGDFNRDGLTDYIAISNAAVGTYLNAGVAGVTTGGQFPGYQVSNATLGTGVNNLTPDTPTAGVTASIDWGDGVVSSGTIAPGQAAQGGQPATFQVLGSHTYTRNGNFTIYSRVTGPSGVTTVINGGSDNVSEIPSPPALKELGLAGISTPGALIPGPAGKLWFTLTQNSSSLNLLSTDGTAVTYPSPVATSGGMPLAPDAAGNAWFCNPAVTAAAGTVYRMDPAGKVTSYTVAGTVNALAAGPTGQMSFLSGPNATSDTVLGVIAQGGSVTSVPLSAPLSASPTCNLVYGPAGYFWLAEFTRGMVARIASDGTVTEIPLPASKAAAAPTGIAAGPDGNLWYTDAQGQSVGKITPAGAVTPFAVGFGPGSICTGPDGALWFSGAGAAGAIGRITTGGALSSYPTGLGGIASVVTGADGNIYLANNGAYTFPYTNADVFRLDLHDAVVLSLATLPSRLHPGDQVSGTLATITDPTGQRTASDFVATVRWENGSEEPADVVPVSGTPGAFAVQASHTYQSEGNWPLTVKVTPHFDLAVTAVATVAVDYPMAAIGSAAGVTVRGRASDPLALMTFSDSDPTGGTASQFTATITWGDGQTSAGTVVAGPTKGIYIVRATHAYNATGSFPVHVSVSDIGGPPITADTTVTVISSPPLQTPVTYNAPAGLLAVGDFNGDGALDLASATPGQLQIDVLNGLPGQAGGTYAAARLAVTAGAPVVAMTSADFNHDGRADLAVTTQTAGQGTAGEHTEVYLGNANGTFTAAGSFASRAGSIVAGDFNGDGVPDLATADAGNPDLVVALGVGDGTFTPATVTLAGGTSSVAAGHFNGDKKTDLAAVLAGTTTVRVLLSNGDGTFAAPATYAGANVAAGAAGAVIATGDFNGDGKKDLAVADASTNTLLVLNGDGTGAFTPLAAAASLVLDESKAAGASVSPTAGLVAADLNGDGIDDLVRAADPASPGQAGLEVKLGEGAGTGRPLTADVAYAVPGHGPFAVAARDLNGDGRTDLVVGGAAGAAGVSVLTNTPYALSPVHPPTTITEGTAFSGLTFGTLTSLAGPLTSAAGMTATITWGDGTASPATLTPSATGGIDVAGSHLYQQAGSYPLSLTVTDAFGVRSTVLVGVGIADAPLQPTGGKFTAVANVPLTALVAAFTDPNPYARLSDMSATISWGNGGTTAGTVLDNGDGTYSVLGTRTYAAAGSYNVSVTFTDAGGAKATAASTVAVTAPVNGGGSISGTVYDDVNFDEARQTGEPPLAGWSVFLDLNDNGAADPGEPAAVTSNAGQYVFPDVPAGTYAVRLLLPTSATHWQQTAPAVASLDRGAQKATVVKGQSAGGADFGATPLPSARVDVGPALRGAPLDSATITFSEPIVGQLTISDLSLTLNGGPNLLTAAQALSTTDHVHFQLQNLSGLAGNAGTYVLSLLDPAVSGTVLADASGNLLTSGASATFTLAAPAVTSVVVNTGSAQRSMVTSLTVTFNQPVTLDAGAFSLTGRNGAGAGTAVTWSNPSGDGLTWVLSFTGPGVTAASVGDGVYDLKVVASAVHPVGAAPGAPLSSMTADYTFTFYRLFGDIDGNGAVSAADYARFRAAFGSAAGSTAFDASFDFDGNGTINSLDYARFRLNFGKSLSF